MIAYSVEDVGTAVGGLFGDGLELFLTYLVPGAVGLAIASVALTWGIRKFRQNAR